MILCYFVYRIDILRESGITDERNRIALNPNRNEFITSDDKSGPQDLTLDTFASMFKFLLLFYLISLFIFIIESVDYFKA